MLLECSPFLWTLGSRFLIVGFIFFIVSRCQRHPSERVSTEPPLAWSLRDAARVLFLTWGGLYLLSAVIGVLFWGDPNALFGRRDLGTIRQLVHSSWGVCVMAALFRIIDCGHRLPLPLTLSTETARRWRDYAALFAVALALVIAKVTLPQLANEPMHSLLFPGPFWFDVIFMVGIAPLLEETVFRGVVYPAFRQRLSAGSAIWLTAVCFALYHAQALTLRSLIYMSLGGALYAYLLEKSGSLVPAVVAHAAENLVYVFAGYFPGVLGAVPFLVLVSFSLVVVATFIRFAVLSDAIPTHGTITSNSKRDSS